MLLDIDLDNIIGAATGTGAVAPFVHANDTKLLVIEVRRLRRAIRKHRDQKGDDRCLRDDEELYNTLPEGYKAPKRDSSVELEMCKKYIETRQNPGTEYVSPQRRIEDLEHSLEAVIGSINRIANIAYIALETHKQPASESSPGEDS